jgi:hypothetical protein
MSISRRISIYLLLILVAACVPVLNVSNQDSNTKTPMYEAVKQTMTMRAREEANSSSEMSTVYADATALGQQSTSQAATDDAAYLATATAILPVLEELPRYGVNPLDGDVSWLHKPVTLDMNGYMQYAYANDYPEVIAADFVLVADITWNTQASTAGCGFVFRSDGNKDKSNQFIVYLARYANGTMLFSALVDGNIASANVFYPKSKDQSFNWLNDSTNRLAVVAHGELLDFYTNGVMIGEVDITKPPPTSIEAPIFPELSSTPSTKELKENQEQASQLSKITNQTQTNLTEAQKNYYSKKISAFTDGFLSFLGASEYGHTVCKFSNAWLFKIRQVPTSTPNRTWTATITPTPTATPRVTYTPLGSGTATATSAPIEETTDLSTLYAILSRLSNIVAR